MNTLLLLGIPEFHHEYSRTPESALNHVLSVLNNSKFELVFTEAGITKIYDFLTIDLQDLKEVTPVHEGSLVTLSVGQQDPTLGIWFTLTTETFHEFLSNYHTTFAVAPTQGSVTKPSTWDTMLHGVKCMITDVIQPKLHLTCCHSRFE